MQIYPKSGKFRILKQKISHIGKEFFHAQIPIYKIIRPQTTPHKVLRIRLKASLQSPKDPSRELSNAVCSLESQTQLNHSV